MRISKISGKAEGSLRGANAGIVKRLLRQIPFRGRPLSPKVFFCTVKSEDRRKPLFFKVDYFGVRIDPIHFLLLISDFITESLHRDNCPFETSHLPFLQIQYILAPPIRKANNEKD